MSKQTDVSTNGSGSGPTNGATATAGPAPVATLSRKDFVSDQEVRWCPGCGDYSILAQSQKVFPEFGVPREQMVFISGIGCSGRTPYYINSYGFHTIHGRAPAIATGLKGARPDLMVWVYTGDGDALSIGGNHLIHALRRNVDIKIVMYNNRIYGLTKGQYSPTSELGKRTKSSPVGTIDTPVSPLSIALAAEATFVARSVDTDVYHLQETLKAAGEHKGSAFVEVLQNCNIFNDGAYRQFTDRDVRDDRMLVLKHGQPLIFGKEKDKGLRFNGLEPEIVELGNGVNEQDLIVHDERAEHPYLAFILSRMWYPEFPVPVGVLRNVEKPTHDELLTEQIEQARAKQGEGKLADLIDAGETWVVD
jgi:2-oxoglutarate/2-oxoacid ferredoxin oxidoreductase subunit beta